ncbi:acyl-CoA dehydrogenase family protein [Novosphingobium flavum]|uniref:Acyl-CoA dehydrogenase family protein n=1 Tax=Novosphingobium aerophilum TaxID=2839843 RepID=A0A7X1F695_9SPHN|nr:acyl-CoA dehydrogenase family protein [Novosphingobium aerophilum]
MPFRADLAAARPEACDNELWAGIVREAAQFAEGVLDPLGHELDRNGARRIDGRVVTAPVHHAAWQQFRELGWMTMVAREPVGQGLPLALLGACEELFNRASAAFYMLPTATRTAATLIDQIAPGPVRDDWVPRLLAGEWAATICISEPDAGSDVGRIRTQARRDGDGWTVTGEKCWISFGDHDLAARIGHMALARSNTTPGVKGLSLFLIPSIRDDGVPNGVSARRIEEKLGLHGSPTCQMGFDGAEAILLGEEGRGLQSLFPMMLQMRLACGPQGTGVATAAYATALAYAQDRRQGGTADAAPVPIATHVDVQRQLLDMAASVELNRALHLTAANALDLAEAAADPGRRAHWMELAQFLLPLVKDGGAWAACDVASKAIQVLGGAGYTQAWPVERHLRDARVFPIFEGTSGIQAIDLLHRRLWREGTPGLSAFVAAVRADALGNAALTGALDQLEAVVRVMKDWKSSPRRAEAGASALLDLCKAVALGWMAARIVARAGTDPVSLGIRAAAAYCLAELEPRCVCLAQLALLGEERLDGVAALTTSSAR